jgi:hypothetical protein
MIERLIVMSSGPGGQGTARPTAETARADAAMATLRQAMAAARAGDHQHGRELCASVLFEIQPILSRHRDLLRTAVCALLMSQGFKLLTRIALALSGRRIRIVLWLGGADRIAPPRSQDEVQETIFTIDPRWLAQLSVEDPFLQGWCNSLATGQASYSGRPTASRARLNPEHV